MDAEPSVKGGSDRQAPVVPAVCDADYMEATVTHTVCVKNWSPTVFDIAEYRAALGIDQQHVDALAEKITGADIYADMKLKVLIPKSILSGLEEGDAQLRYVNELCTHLAKTAEGPALSWAARCLVSCFRPGGRRTQLYRAPYERTIDLRSVGPGHRSFDVVFQGWRR